MIYTQLFLNALNHLMKYEVGGLWDVNAPGVRDGTNLKACGYVNDPLDSGGETKYGIAKNSNLAIDIKHLNWESAKAIYYNNYWTSGKCDQMIGRVAVLHFDGCVNNGIGNASKFLQKAINVVVDGSIGINTLKVLNLENPITVCNLICDQRIAFYKNIILSNPSQAKYQAGWLRRIAEMRTYTTDPAVTF